MSLQTRTLRRFGVEKLALAALVVAAGCFGTVIALQLASAATDPPRSIAAPLESPPQIVTRVNPPARDQWYLDAQSFSARDSEAPDTPPVRDQWYLDES